VELGQLEVLQSRQQDGIGVPLKAQFTVFNFTKRNAEGTPKILWMYKINITGFKKINSPLQISPELTGPTRITDLRSQQINKGPIFDYVSDSWKTMREAEKALHKGDIRIIRPSLPFSKVSMPMVSRGSHTRVWLCALLIVLAGVATLKIKERIGKS
jgi:hypothetical protein